jgi:uncharacterized protein (DUF488 family)
MKIYTIGVYNSSEHEFFNKLIENNITHFIDIRRRRAVRGSKYSFVNSTRLQNILKSLNINYTHLLDLAPTNEIRQLQKNADKKNTVLKSKRENLSSDFINSYNIDILKKFSLEYFVKLEKYNKIVLFCVEEKAHSCHRSLVTDKLESEYGFKIVNL